MVVVPRGTFSLVPYLKTAFSDQGGGNPVVQGVINFRRSVWIDLDGPLKVLWLQQWPILIWLRLTIYQSRNR